MAHKPLTPEEKRKARQLIEDRRTNIQAQQRYLLELVGNKHELIRVEQLKVAAAKDCLEKLIVKINTADLTLANLGRDLAQLDRDEAKLDNASTLDKMEIMRQQILAIQSNQFRPPEDVVKAIAERVRRLVYNLELGAINEKECKFGIVDFVYKHIEFDGMNYDNVSAWATSQMTAAIEEYRVPK